MKLLPIFRDNEKYSDSIKKAIEDFFKENLYDEIEKVLYKYFKQYYNSNNQTLINAILSGRIQYIDGKIEGSFNKTISRQLLTLGATFDNRTKKYKLELNSMPQDVQQAFAVSNSLFKAAHQDILSILDNFNLEESISTFDLTKQFNKAIETMDLDLYNQVKDMITIEPNLTPEIVKAIAKDYSDSTTLYISDFVEEEVKKLRKEVIDNTFQGYRAESLVSKIMKSYNTSENKAKFLARQETSLLVSKYREERYKSAGIKRYKWSTSGDDRVRDDHKHLDGEIFSWDTPPITNRNTGKKGNPGSDYNCRCVAVAIVDW